MRRLRSALVNLSVLAATLAIALLAAEAALRLLGMTAPVTYRPDRVYGYEPRPNQSSTRLGVSIYIDDLGLRDDEDSAAVVAGRTRILVLGNSVTYGGSRVRQQDLLTEVLERRLDESKGGVKVMNAGVNGYSVSQMLGRATRLVRSTHPQVIVMYTIRGDFLRPPVQFLSEGNFVYPLRRPRSALADFVLLSVNHLNKRYPVIEMMPRWLARYWDAPANVVPPYDTARIVDTHLAALGAFVRTTWHEVGGTPAQIVVLIAPTRADVMAGRLEPNADIVARLRSLGVQAHDLGRDFHEAIVARGEDAADYYWDSVHYVEKGHALAGTVAAKYVGLGEAEMGLLDRPAAARR